MRRRSAVVRLRQSGCPQCLLGRSESLLGRSAGLPVMLVCMYRCDYILQRTSFSLRWSPSSASLCTASQAEDSFLSRYRPRTLAAT